MTLVNPDDLAMLERSHELLEGLGELAAATPASDAALEACEMEDRPDPEARVEDAKQIAAILRL